MEFRKRMHIRKMRMGVGADLHAPFGPDRESVEYKRGCMQLARRHQKCSKKNLNREMSRRLAREEKDTRKMFEGGAF